MTTNQSPAPEGNRPTHYVWDSSRHDSPFQGSEEECQTYKTREELTEPGTINLSVEPFLTPAPDNSPLPPLPDDLPPELREYLSTVPKVTAAEYARLEQAAREVFATPSEPLPTEGESPILVAATISAIHSAVGAKRPDLAFEALSVYRAAQVQEATAAKQAEWREKLARLDGAIRRSDELYTQYEGQRNRIEELQQQLKEREELSTMQLAGISTATWQNTEGTAKDRIDRSNPYWTVAYGDVCVAIDREMKHRTRVEVLEAQLSASEALVKQLREALQTADDCLHAIAQRYPTFVHEVYGDAEHATDAALKVAILSAPDSTKEGKA